MKEPAARELLFRTLEIAEHFLTDGREDEALMIAGCVLDVLEKRAKEERWLR